MIEKDINLFEANRMKSPHKKGGSSVLLLSLFFALVVAGSYGWLRYLQADLEQKTAQIEQQLADPALVEAQEKLKVELERFNLMAEYRNELKAAGDAFDKTRQLNPALMDQLTSCLPADTTVTSINATLQGATFYCSSPNFLAPATIVQALERLDSVASASYDSVARGADGRYTFALVCSFKEVTLP